MTQSLLPNINRALGLFRTTAEFEQKFSSDANYRIAVYQRLNELGFKEAQGSYEEYMLAVSGNTHQHYNRLQHFNVDDSDLFSEYLSTDENFRKHIYSQLRESEVVTDYQEFMLNFVDRGTPSGWNAMAHGFWHSKVAGIKGLNNPEEAREYMLDQIILKPYEDNAWNTFLNIGSSVAHEAIRNILAVIPVTAPLAMPMLIASVGFGSFVAAGHKRIENLEENIQRKLEGRTDFISTDIDILTSALSGVFAALTEYVGGKIQINLIKYLPPEMLLTSHESLVKALANKNYKTFAKGIRNILVTFGTTLAAAGIEEGIIEEGIEQIANNLVDKLLIDRQVKWHKDLVQSVWHGIIGGMLAAGPASAISTISSIYNPSVAAVASILELKPDTSVQDAVFAVDYLMNKSGDIIETRRTIEDPTKLDIILKSIDQLIDITKTRNYAQMFQEEIYQTILNQEDAEFLRIAQGKSVQDSETIGQILLHDTTDSTNPKLQGNLYVASMFAAHLGISLDTFLDYQNGNNVEHTLKLIQSVEFIIDEFLTYESLQKTKLIEFLNENNLYKGSDNEKVKHALMAYLMTPNFQKQNFETYKAIHSQVKNYLDTVGQGSILYNYGTFVFDKNKVRSYQMDFSVQSSENIITNTIYSESVDTTMKNIPNSSINLAIFNENNISNKSLDTLSKFKDFVRDIYKRLKDGGTFLVEISNINLATERINTLKEVGFKVLSEGWTWNNLNQDNLSSKKYIVVYKGDTPPSSTNVSIGILRSPDSSIRTINMHSDMVKTSNNTTEVTEVTPKGLTAYFIEAFSNEGDVIYDPFMTDGSYALSARDLNRTYIGNESSGEFTENINYRLTNEQLKNKDYVKMFSELTDEEAGDPQILNISDFYNESEIGNHLNKKDYGVNWSWIQTQRNSDNRGRIILRDFIKKGLSVRTQKVYAGLYQLANLIPGVMVDLSNDAQVSLMVDNRSGDFYDNTIRILTPSTQNVQHDYVSIMAFNHELVHAFFNNSTFNLTMVETQLRNIAYSIPSQNYEGIPIKMDQNIRRILQQIFPVNTESKELTRQFNPEELIAYAFSDIGFAQWLDNLPYYSLATEKGLTTYQMTDVKVDSIFSELKKIFKSVLFRVKSNANLDVSVFDAISNTIDSMYAQYMKDGTETFVAETDTDAQAIAYAKELEASRTKTKGDSYIFTEKGAHIRKVKDTKRPKITKNFVQDSETKIYRGEIDNQAYTIEFIEDTSKYGEYNTYWEIQTYDTDDAVEPITYYIDGFQAYNISEVLNELPNIIFNKNRTQPKAKPKPKVITEKTKETTKQKPVIEIESKQETEYPKITQPFDQFYIDGTMTLIGFINGQEHTITMETRKDGDYWVLKGSLYNMEKKAASHDSRETLINYFMTRIEDDYHVRRKQTKPAVETKPIITLDMEHKTAEVDVPIDKPKVIPTVNLINKIKNAHRKLNRIQTQLEALLRKPLTQNSQETITRLITEQKEQTKFLTELKHSLADAEQNIKSQVIDIEAEQTELKALSIGEKVKGYSIQLINVETILPGETSPTQVSLALDFQKGTAKNISTGVETKVPYDAIIGKAVTETKKKSKSKPNPKVTTIETETTAETVEVDESEIVNSRAYMKKYFPFIGLRKDLIESIKPLLRKSKTLSRENLTDVIFIGSADPRLDAIGAKLYLEVLNITEIMLRHYPRYAPDFNIMHDASNYIDRVKSRITNVMQYVGDTPTQTIDNLQTMFKDMHKMNSMINQLIGNQVADKLSLSRQLKNIASDSIRLIKARPAIVTAMVQQLFQKFMFSEGSLSEAYKGLSQKNKMLFDKHAVYIFEQSQVENYQKLPYYIEADQQLKDYYDKTYQLYQKHMAETASMLERVGGLPYGRWKEGTSRGLEKNKRNILEMLSSTEISAVKKTQLLLELQSIETQLDIIDKYNYVPISLVTVYAHQLTNELTEIINKHNQGIVLTAEEIEKLRRFNANEYIGVPFLKTYVKKFHRRVKGNPHLNEIISAVSEKEQSTISKDRTMLSFETMTEDGLIDPNKLSYATIMGIYATNVANTYTDGLMLQQFAKDGVILNERQALRRGWRLDNKDKVSREKFMKDWGINPIGVSGEVLVLHPDVQNYLNELRDSQKMSWSLYNRILRNSKNKVFINPVRLPLNDVFQSVMAGTFTIKGLSTAFSQYFNNHSNYLEMVFFGGISTPTSTPKYVYVNDFILATRNVLGKIAYKLHQAHESVKGSKFGDGLLLNTLQYPAVLIELIYDASQDLAWKLDQVIRLMTYNHLKSEGYSPLVSGQYTALYHGDYADVPPKVRKALNNIFFTPTFRISMIRLYNDLLRSADKVFRTPDKIGQHDIKHLRSIINILAINFAFDMFMTGALGYDREEWGRRYKKDIETPTGPKTFYTTMTSPANIIQKHIGQFMSMTDPTKFDKFRNFLTVIQYDLHPVWRVLLEAYKNYDDVVRDPTAPDYIQHLTTARYIIQRIYQLFPTLMGSSDQSDSRQLFVRETNQVIGTVMALVLSAYETVPDAQRISNKVTELMTMVYSNARAIDPRDGTVRPLTQKDIARINKIINDSIHALEKPKDTMVTKYLRKARVGR